MSQTRPRNPFVGSPPQYLCGFCDSRQHAGCCWQSQGSPGRRSNTHEHLRRDRCVQTDVFRMSKELSESICISRASQCLAV